MTYTVYFTDKSVTFTDQAPHTAPLAADADFSRSKVIKNLQTANSLLFVVADATAAYRTFAAQFVQVEAAGGVVRNRLGEWLLIYRRGRWDLPKGHVECGESTRQAALRETREETGIGEVRILHELCNTLHAYNVYGEWELKRTAWFEMQCLGSEPLVPQEDEGIERVEWCSAAKVREYLSKSYPTIKDVFRKTEIQW